MKVEVPMQTTGKSNQGKKVNPGESFYTADIAAQYDDIRKKDRYWNWEDEVLEKALTLLSSDDRLVDCPFGTGRFLSLYKKYNLKVLGLDISKDMLFEAEKKVKQLNLEDKVQMMNVDLNEFKNSGEPLKALVSFRLLHLISPGHIEAFVTSLAEMPSCYIFLQLFTVYDYSPMHILKRLGQVFLMNKVSAKDKIIYFARTLYSIHKKLFVWFYSSSKDNTPKKASDEKAAFCDVTYFHSLHVIEKTVEKKGFFEKERFELMDLIHVQNESATRATALIIFKKN